MGLRLSISNILPSHVSLRTDKCLQLLIVNVLGSLHVERLQLEGETGNDRLKINNKIQTLKPNFLKRMRISYWVTRI